MFFYYLDNNHEQIGPLGIEQLKSVDLKPDTLVWTEGLDSWKPAKKVEELMYQMAWRFDLLPVGDRDNPVECYAWNAYWLEKAAKAGHVDARIKYAKFLIDRPMNADDRQKAMCYFQNLVDDLNNDKLKVEQLEAGAYAKLWLGIMLCEGYYTRCDEKEGKKLIMEAKSFNGFESLGFMTMYKIGELYATGMTLPKGSVFADEIADMEQGIEYLSTAIGRFDSNVDRPQYRGLAERLLKNTKELKETRESLYKNLQGLGSSFKIPENPTFAGADERRRKITEMRIIPEAQQSMDVGKAALERLRQRLAWEGW